MKKMMICGAVIAVVLSGCNNFFHELIPPDGNVITSFEVPGQINASIGENRIDITVAKGTDLRCLLPRISVSHKASLFPVTLDYIAAAFPSADLVREAVGLYTANNLAARARALLEQNPDFNVPSLDMPIDFSGPVVFFVISAMGTIRQYTVYVLEDTNEPKLLGLSFSKYDNPELVSDAFCMINEASLAVTALAVYPAEMTSLSYALVPSFQIIGDGFEIDGVPVISGMTAIQFSPSLGTQVKTITVTRDGLTKNYSLTVLFTEDPDTVRSITDFRFNKIDNPAITATAAASIINNGNTGTITVQVFYSGIKPSTLIPRCFTERPVYAAVYGNGGILQHDKRHPEDYLV